MRNTNFECSVIFWCGRIQAPNILSRKNDIGFSRKRIYFSLSISMSVLNALLNLLLQFHSKTFLSTVIIIMGIDIFSIVMQVHFLQIRMQFLFIINMFSIAIIEKYLSEVIMNLKHCSFSLSILKWLMSRGNNLLGH